MFNKVALFFGLLVACSLAADVVGPGCTANVVATARGEGWQEGTGRAVIYDITVTNAGSCPLSNIGINLGYDANSRIKESWNLEATSRYYLVKNFGPLLYPGSSTTAGVTLLTTASTLPSLSVTVYGSSCPETCVNPTGTPTAEPTTAPTTAPTSEPTSAPTAVPTSTPTSVPTSTPTNPPTTTCSNIESTITKTNTWQQDGVETSSYTVTIRNNGNCPLVAFVTSFGYYPGTLVQTWNLESSRGGYAVTGFGPSIAPGQVYSGAGLVVSGVSSVALQVYGTACQC